MRPSVLPAAIALVILAAATPPDASAQATRDQSRLVFTVSPGYVFGADLWRIPDQPLLQPPSSVDTIAISRRIRPTFGVSFQGAYYPGDHVGVVAEAFLVGLGYGDGCRTVHSSGSAQNLAVCEAIDGSERAASGVALSAGIIYRIHSRRTISPYARATVGAALTSQSSTRVTATIGDPISGPVDVPVFIDEKDTRLRPSLGLGIGFTAALAPAYQLRWELRDNITGVRVVDGATTRTPIVPAARTEYKHLFAMLIGLDVVLERRRGRRY